MANIVYANMLFFPLYYNILSLTSLKITQVFLLLLGFAENQTVFWDFKIRNSIRITEGSDNRDSDNRGSTVFIDWYVLFVHTYRLLEEGVTSDPVYYDCSDDEIALNVSVH